MKNKNLKFKQNFAWNLITDNSYKQITKATPTSKSMYSITITTPITEIFSTFDELEKVTFISQDIDTALDRGLSSRESLVNLIMIEKTAKQIHFPKRILFQMFTIKHAHLYTLLLQVLDRCETKHKQHTNLSLKIPHNKKTIYQNVNSILQFF